MTQYRVHELATSFGVTPEEIVEYLAGVGRKVRGRSAVLGESDAARVRRRFERARPKPAESDPAQLSGPAPAVAVAAPTAAAAPTADDRTTPTPRRTAARPAADGRAAPQVQHDLLNPFATSAATGPGTGPARPPARRPGPPAARPVPAKAPVATVNLAEIDVVDERLEDWQRRGFEGSERAEWIAAGLRPTESGIADHCRTAGITPDQLALRLSGRTALLRLRDGETATSVWARIQDGEHEPRRPTRLSGRFKLG